MATAGCLTSHVCISRGRIQSNNVRGASRNLLPAKSRSSRLVVKSSLRMPHSNDQCVERTQALSAAASLAALAAASPAAAVSELAQVADGRVSSLLLLLGPALGWVGFNILGPALNQLDDMSTKKKSVAGAVGLTTAALLAAPQSADAAQELAQVADGRLSALLFVLGPAVAWVLFNILGPALNQLDDMSTKKKSVAGAAGLTAAALLATPQSADAAQELAQVADGRPFALLFVLGPAVAWVLFNILGPALNQLDDMSAKKKSIAGAAGLTTAALLGAPQSADAAQELAQVADGRLSALLFVLGPAVAWVGFNILGPALNQLDDMSAKKK